MSNPIKYCSICLRSRDCMLHANGRGFPPDKAEKWLRKTCPNTRFKTEDGKALCQISYRAGIGTRGLLTGQTEQP